jgi:hypothetical protein
MAMTRSGLRDRIARLERRSVEQVADVIAELHQRTGLSIKAIVDEAERMAAYYRLHGEWPPAVLQAVQTAKADEVTIRLSWDNTEAEGEGAPAGEDNLRREALLEPPPEPPVVVPVERNDPPEPEEDPDDELEATVRQLVDEVRRRLRP